MMGPFFYFGPRFPWSLLMSPSKLPTWVVASAAGIATAAAAISFSWVPIERIGVPSAKPSPPPESHDPGPQPPPTKEALSYVELADVYLPNVQASIARAGDGVSGYYDCFEIESARKDYNRAAVFLSAAARLYGARNTMPEAYERWKNVEESLTPGLAWCAGPPG